MSKNKKTALLVFSSGKKMYVHVTKILCNIKNKYQQIKIIDTQEFGRCLIIDGLMQAAETDHEIYDAQMLSLLKKEDKNILILGGGDGYLAIHTLKMFPNTNISIVDIDKDVIKFTKKYIHTKESCEYERINFIKSDALIYLKRNKNKFDAILSDLTDTPVGVKEEKEFRFFYNELLHEIYRTINPTGWICLQGGATKVTNKYIPAINILKKITRKYFLSVKESSIYIPSYGEYWSFLFGTKKHIK